MKRAIIRNNLMLLISAFILFFVIVFFSLYRFERANQTSIMTFLLNEVETSYLNFDGDEQAFVMLFEQTDRRITILDDAGRVVADTHNDVVGTDKSERPEILDLGTVHTRTSATINVELLYIATRLDDGSYLRVSIPLESQTAIYQQTTWILIISASILIVLYYMGLSRVNQNLIKPWTKVKEGLIKLNKGQYQMMSLNSPYEEINEILHEMNQINFDTSMNLNKLDRFQKQLDFILSEIKQGIMLFDHQNHLLFMNPDAMKLFELDKKSLHKESYQIFRDKNINQALKHHQNLKVDMDFQGKTYELSLYPLVDEKKDAELASMLLTAKDVTEERHVGQMKRDFFSHASHELKSPLQAIRGFAELVLYDMIKDENEIKEISSRIVEQTSFMSALVEDMLMLSRLENLHEEISQTVHLSEMIESSVQTLKTVYKRKKMIVHLDLEDVTYDADPLDMQKLFKNLIENAFKYSEEQKTIDISLKQNKNQYIFEVIDKGFGIAKDQQARIFERFYRIDKGRLDGGTGLGLAIVKHIAIKYDIEIEVISTLHVGTTITLKFKA